MKTQAKKKPKNTLTTNIKGKEQRQTLNIKPQQATYNRPPPRTIPFYIFSPRYVLRQQIAIRPSRRKNKKGDGRIHNENIGIPRVTLNCQIFGFKLKSYRITITIDYLQLNQRFFVGHTHLTQKKRHSHSPRMLEDFFRTKSVLDGPTEEKSSCTLRDFFQGPLLHQCLKVFRPKGWKPQRWVMDVRVFTGVQTPFQQTV